MIGWISGQFVSLSDSMVLINVGGIGYEIDCTNSTCRGMPEFGETVTIFTHMQTREDGQYLFGFLEKSERDCFRMLIRINGVGPRLAMGIL